MNRHELQDKIATKISQNYNVTQLLDWVHNQIEWVDIGELETRSTDPIEIIEIGKGHCGEFSILYLVGCLTLGYEARWMVSVRPYSYSGLHNWVEVKINDQWVHVEPTDKIWNASSMYAERNWWGKIGRDAKVYAFELGKFEDVSEKYAK